MHVNFPIRPYYMYLLKRTKIVTHFSYLFNKLSFELNERNSVPFHLRLFRLWENRAIANTFFLEIPIEFGLK